jgi:large subunit ribosomal protein L23
MSKDAVDIIIRPHITERTMALAFGDRRIQDEKLVQRKYTFIVAPDANKIEIKKAFEAIYNEGRKDKEKLVVEEVRTMIMKGKTRRIGQRAPGKKADRKKAIITLAKGQLLEDYGV